MASRSAAPNLRTTVPPLLTAIVPAPGRVVVRLTGEADVSTAGLLSDVLTEAAALGTPLVVVDIAAVRFWDVSGLHALAAFTAALAGSGRQCRLVGANASTRRLVALADFTNSLQLDGPLEVPATAVAEPADAPATVTPATTDSAPRRRFWCGLRRRGGTADEHRPSAADADLSRTVGSRRWR